MTQPPALEQARRAAEPPRRPRDLGRGPLPPAGPAPNSPCWAGVEVCTGGSSEPSPLGPAQPEREIAPSALFRLLRPMSASSCRSLPTSCSDLFSFCSLIQGWGRGQSERGTGAARL